MSEYEGFIKKIRGSDYNQLPSTAHSDSEVHNPFTASDNSNLSFIGRDLNT